MIWLLRLVGMVPVPVWIGSTALLSGLCAWQEVRVIGYRMDARTAEVRLVQAETRFDQERAQAVQKSRAYESALQAFADKARSDRDAKINRLRADVRGLRSRLQYLPARPADTEAAGAGQAAAQCDGPVLYREVGQSLADEAERADTIRIELQRVYQLWDEAREISNKKQ